jgi:hypothetical protein
MVRGRCRVPSGPDRDTSDGAMVAQRQRSIDPTVYPVEEKVGEDILQTWIVEVFRPLLERYLTNRGVRAFVGADQFIYYRQFEPTERFAPDVYVLPGLAPDTHVSAWKIWETGLAPSFCLEVVSKEWEKDYVEAPMNCKVAGVTELVIFDPHFKRRPRHEGLLFQVYRRVPRKGFVRVDVTNEYRVRSKTLGCWLRAVGSGRMMRLRIGTGPRGDELLPTAEEQERYERAEKEQARAEKEHERIQKEHERAEKEHERAEKERALARVAELERELAALRGARSAARLPSKRRRKE